MSDFDLAAYLKRVGHEGPVRPDLATLTTLHARQADAIPFENLDPLLGRSPLLDLENLQAKLVGSRRGGYCYELNALFMAALETIGFQVIPLAARVRWMAPPDRPMGGRTHMLLRVDLPEGPYLADPGFGGLLGAPIRLEPDIEQSTPWETLKLVRHEGPAGEGDLMLWAKFDGEWVTAYLLGFQPQLSADYVLSNWFTSTSPDIIFTGNLRLDRLTSGGRLSLFNTKLTERPSGAPAHHRMIETAAELDRVIAEDFGIEAPAPASTYFERLPKA